MVILSVASGTGGQRNLSPQWPAGQGIFVATVDQADLGLTEICLALTLDCWD